MEPVEEMEDIGGFRHGSIWRRGTGWFWTVGSEFTRGPYSSKAKALASANRYFRSCDRKENA